MRQRISLILTGLLLFSLSACKPTNPGITTSWRVVQLLSQQEQIESITEVRTVRHCGPIVEQKAISCIAGTSNELSFNLGGSGGVSLGAELTMDASIGNALGLNRESGEQLELPIPPDGSVYHYIVTTEYRVLNGEALARSSSGEERNATYTFQATCTLRIESVEEDTCPQMAGNTGGETGGETSGEATPEATPTPDTTAMLDQANQLYQQGQFSEAINVYAQVLEIDPKNAIAYNQRGNAYRQLEQYDLCINDYTQAIQNASSQAESATYYANRGAAFALQGDLQRALEDFTQAITINPNFARAYESRAAVYQQLGMFDAMVADYSAFLSLKPDSVNAYLQRAQGYEHLGDLQAAIQDYTQATSLQPDDASAYFNRGQLYQQLGDFASARADYDRVLQLDPNHARAYFARGSLAYQQGDYGTAISDLSRALDLGYGNPDVYAYRGLAYLQQQQGAPAVDDLTQTLNLAPERIDLYFYRAQAYVLTEDPKAAIEDLSTFLQLAPADSPLRPEAEKLLAALRKSEPATGGSPIVPATPVTPNK